jgi:hypothetical protein
MPRFITTICFCLMASLAIAQIDSSSLDSLSRRIHSDNIVSQAYNDSTIRARDSIRKVQLDSLAQAETIQSSTERGLNFWAEENERRRKKQLRNAYLQIALGLAGFGLLIFSILRNRKRKKEQEAKNGGKV